MNSGASGENLNASPPGPGRPLRVALVAGETSGDLLGAALMAALRARRPDVQFIGVAGPRMRAQGCELLADSEQLAVMGLFEVLAHLPRLLVLRAQLRRQILAAEPDVFVGVDFKEFNLALAAQLKLAGLRTVQYVSPQVWAWRPGRVRTIARACDLILCLLPFEPPFYAGQAVRARFVGHPMADELPLLPDRIAARQALQLDAERPVVALLPGSRMSEVQRLGLDYIATADWLAQRRPQLQFVVPLASARVAAEFRRLQQRAAQLGMQPPMRLLDGQARTALQAADVALVASGTATLEAALCGTPMAVAYRLGTLTAWLLRKFNLVKVQNFALPNLLAGETLVPEFFQEQVQPQALGAALLALLDDPARRRRLSERFAAIHLQLRQGGAEAAAGAVLELLAQQPGAGP
ncbi:MAG: lipid-A-disaccharide synthase [Steroidobacteraceae bacterium]